MAEEGSRSKQMAESSSCICTICLQAVRDARLLTCFHSFCKSCLDELDMRKGHAHKITCPVCRSTSRLPKDGASGLARDITVAVNKTTECDTCSAEGGEGKAEVICTTCDLLFCSQHGIPHLLAKSHNDRHSLVAIPEGAASSYSRPATSSARLCDEHGLPARLVCQQCNVAVCGECTTLGEHSNHKPVVTIKDIAEDLKHRVRRKIAQLKNVNLPSAQRVLLAVDDVSSQLSLHADKARTEIRSSAQRIHDIVEVVMQQKLAEVDDLEELRLKHLNRQHDELQQHVDSLKSVIGFSERVLEAETQTQKVCDLLFSVEKRAEELDKARVADKPVEHPRVDFKGVSEETLLTKVKELGSVVDQALASAAHSFIDGQTEKTCVEDSSVSFVVVAKDTNSHRLATGGDIIQVQLQQGPACPSRDVVDNNNGTYTISVTAHQHGDYSFDVFVNNEKLQQHLTISCLPFVFDPAECQAGNAISEDKCIVTHTEIDTWSSVLGSRGMSTGQHIWKVKVTKTETMKIFLGVAEKPGLTAKHKSYSSTYSWLGWGCNKWIISRYCKSMCPWQKNDVLQLELNCTNHTLSMTNLRSGETDIINNLPPAELFAYFSTCNQGDSLTLIG